MRVLVTFAVEAEFAPWRKRHDFRPAQTSQGEKAHAANISGVEVFVGLTGIGPKAASSRICDFTWCEDFDLFISSGFAGALRSEHQIADILAARELVADEDRTKALGRKVLSTQRLLKIAEECGAKLVGGFYSSPSTIRTAAEKAALRDAADAVEMESFEILAEAFVWIREGIAIRAVSDTADEDLPLDFDQVVTDSGDLSVARLAGQIIREPSVIPGLISLGRRSGKAAGRLADFLDAYVAALAGRPQAIASSGVSST
jgi:adenosylhomocysteine nucleosidase